MTKFFQWGNHYLPFIIIVPLWFLLLIPRWFLMLLILIVVPQAAMESGPIRRFFDFLEIEPSDGGY